MEWNKKQKFQVAMAIMVFVLVFAITWQIKGVRKKEVRKYEFLS